MNDNETVAPFWVNVAANDDSNITPYDDIIDTRQLVERIAELERAIDDLTDENVPTDPDEADDFTERIEALADELARLKPFAATCERSFTDYLHGVALIRDSHFQSWAEEYADDIGAINNEAGWPIAYIDWPAAAKALQIDYTAVEFDGITYWGR